MGTKVKVATQVRTHSCLPKVKDEAQVFSRKVKIHIGLTRGIKKNNKREDIAKINSKSLKKRMQGRFNS